MFLIYGWNPAFYETHREKNLVVLLEEEKSLSPTVQYHVVKTPLQIEILARQLAWQAVFQPVEIVEGEGPKAYFSFFKKTFESCHLAANLLLSDAADYGIEPLKNAFFSRKRKVRSALHLEGAFQNIPAIIAGAGPSLPSLQAFEKKALIFAGGAALDRIDVKPHFAAAIDKEGPLQKIPSRDVPFCFQSRLNHTILSQVKGPLLRVPESHFEFLRYLEGEEKRFDGGWTVGTFLVALAVLWGCNPIILVGMDFCYKNGKKYARDQQKAATENLILTQSRKGEEVLTQNDWQMAVHWLGEYAKQHSDRQFFDGSGDGMDLGSCIPVKKLADFAFSTENELRETVNRIIKEQPSIKQSEKRWKLWIEELKQGGTLVQEKLLEPLWQIWQPIFQREVKQERDLKIHQMIFSEKVRKEHLDVLH